MQHYFICYHHPTYGRIYETKLNETSAWEQVAEIQEQLGLNREDIFVFHESTRL